MLSPVIAVWALLPLLLCTTTTSAIELSQFDVFKEITPGYTIHWKLNHDKSVITLGFNVTAAKGNYFAFGIGEFTTGSMPGSDILVFEVSGSAVEIKDYFAYGFSFPVLDDCQSWKLEASEILTADDGSVNAVHAIVTRSTSILGDHQDRPFEVEPNRMTQLLWAIGSTPTLSYHASNRGKTGVFFAGLNLANSPSDSLFVDFRINNFEIPAQKTAYTSQSFMAPSLSAQLYIRGFEIIHGKQLDRIFLHHAVLYACENGNSSWIQRVYGTPASGFNEECSLAVYTWTPGSESNYLPQNVHISMGVNGWQYFVLGAHFDNPYHGSGQVTNVGVRVLYETTPRENEASALQLAEAFGMYSKPLPKGQSAVHLEFDCPSSCTSTLAQPIHIFQAFIHAHGYGRQIWSTVWRKDGLSSETFIRGDYFDFGSQHNAPVNVTVYPGDRISTHCVYDTSTAPNDVHIGPGTEDEMCQVYLLYYPKVDFPYCVYFEDASVSSENMTVCGTVANILDVRNPSQKDNPSGLEIVAGSRRTPMQSCSGLVVAKVTSHGSHSSPFVLVMVTLMIVFATLIVGAVMYFRHSSRKKISFSPLELTEG